MNRVALFFLGSIEYGPIDRVMGQDLIEFSRYSQLSGAGWGDWGMLEGAMRTTSGTVVDAVLNDSGLRVAANDAVWERAA